MKSIIFDLDNRVELFNSIISSYDYEQCDDNKLIRGELSTETFSDGEVSAHFNTSVRGKRIYILTCPNTSDKIMQLMLIIDAAKRAAATEIIPIITYMPYCRSDKKDQTRGAIGAKVMGEMIENRGATHIITFDLHADQIQGFFNIPVIHMEGKFLFDRYIIELHKDGCGDNIVLCAPDAGAAKRVKGYRDQIKDRWDIDLSIVMVDKTRKKANEIDSVVIIGDVSGKDIIIIDDMCDTGGTLVKAATELKLSGAKSVRSIVTHGVLSGPALQRIYDAKEDGIIEDFVCSDSLPVADRWIFLEQGVYPKSEEFITIVSTVKQIVKGIIATEKQTSVDNLKKN